MMLYRFGKWLCGICLKISGLQIIGKENVPADQPVLVIANHLSFADPPILAQAFPYHLTFIAKEDFAKHAFTRILFGALGAVFLKRGESDLSAMRRVLALLKEKHSAAIFPEGRRTFEQGLAEFQPGAAFLAARSNTPVVPVALVNSGHFFKFWKRDILMHVGEVIDPQQLDLPMHEKIPALNQMFQESVAALKQQSEDILTERKRLPR
ncbi:MAG: 1-acyl-sn-glycerol-3-phosphate acyltransferase [Firmicutes bacterium]|nr:1-acyl-sn-glycerol-3-phosphate acyltransferase [Bacillota bacterium]